MLTETEILDEQVQTLDEALDKLEEHSAEPITPNELGDVDAGHALSVTVECLKATRDLYHTISQEGVSAADVQALRSIRDRMSPYMTLTPKVALEAYEGMFTPNRSMINQVISQEATLAEIGTTLKEWFFKFLDFVIKIVDWCRVVWNSEEAVRIRLKALDSNLQSMYNAFDDCLVRNKLAGVDMLPQLTAIAKVVLTDPKLTRSEAMLIAFGLKGHDSVIVHGDKDIDYTFNLLMKDVASLKTHVEQNKPMAVGIDFATDLHVTAEAMEELLVATDEVDFFFDHLGTEFWMHPKRLVGRPIYAPSHNILQVQRLAKEFRTIKRNVNFDNLKEVDILVQTVENISGCVQGLERVIAFKQKLYGDYYKASATMANFYIRGRDVLIDQIAKNGDEDINRVVLTKLNKVWDEILKKMGM
jgi:hypothetical protein